MAEFLMFLFIAALVVATIACLVAFMSEWRTRERAFIVAFFAACLSAIPGLILLAAGSYIAGQGDGAKAAREWVAKYRKGWTVGECQPRDVDDNKYITCTLVGPSPDDNPEPIECGVNRWYHGMGVSGCKPVFYQSGGARR